MPSADGAASLAGYLRQAMDPDERLAKDILPQEIDIRLINRTSFGIRQEDVERVRLIGLEAYFAEQLDPASIDDSEVESMIDALFPAIQAPLSEIVSMNPFEAAVQLQSANLVQALFSKRQLFEVMVEFWTNHFNINIYVELPCPSG